MYMCLFLGRANTSGWAIFGGNFAFRNGLGLTIKTACNTEIVV